MYKSDEQLDSEGPAFLYAMRRGVDGAIKIGVSRNPQLRLLHLISNFKVLEIEPATVDLVDWVFLRRPYIIEWAMHRSIKGDKANCLGPGTTNEWWFMEDEELKWYFNMLRRWPEELAL